jgi:hypothetical protein
VRPPLLVQRLFFNKPMICGWAVLGLLLGALGQARSGFVAPLAFDARGWSVSVAVGDFNGDGIPDLAVANNGDNTVSVLLGNGDGTFQAAQNFAAGSNPQAWLFRILASAAPLPVAESR